MNANCRQDNVEVTTTTESSLTSPVCPDKVSCRWVYFAQYVETCGSVSAQDYNPGSICGPACGGGAPEAPSCSGSVVTTGNVCSLTPYTLGGQPQLMYTVRKWKLTVQSHRSIPEFY